MLSDSRVCVGAFAKGRSSSRKLNYVLRRVAGLTLSHDLTLDLVCVPTWANPADAPSRGRTLRDWRASLPDWLPEQADFRGLPLWVSDKDRLVWERLWGPGVDGTMP